MIAICVGHEVDALATKFASEDAEERQQQIGWIGRQKAR